MDSNSNIIQIKSFTYSDICNAVAAKVRSRRLELNLTQAGFAERSGVNVETYRKFERTGDISLKNLAKLALNLNAADDFEGLFAQKQYQNLDELLNAGKINRKRGKKK